MLWFVEVQRRGLHRQLGHASLQLYATQARGFSDNRYWQFKRLADDLDRLPALKSAVVAGEVGWTKAQQVARVATPATQSAWVNRARTVGRRELEREVRVAKAATRPSRSGSAAQLRLDTGRATKAALGANGGVASAQVEAATVTPAPVPATITLRADALQVARFEALVEKVRRLGAVVRAADRFDVVLAGLEALVEAVTTAESSPSAGPRGAAPAHQIVVHECPTCGAAAAITDRGDLPLAPAQVERARCDARVSKRGKPNRATIPPRVRAAVPCVRARAAPRYPACGRLSRNARTRSRLTS